MKIKIAIPDNPLYAPLVARAEEVCRKYNFDIIKANEVRCADLLLRNSVELALLSPYGYGKAVGKVDYRIIPGPALMLEGYTKAASIYFRPGACSIETASANFPNDFLMLAAVIALNDKFDMALEVRQSAETPEQQLEKSDCVIAWGNAEDVPVALDVSDEWFDSVTFPLPTMFWACRPEEMPENIAEIVAEMADPDLMPEEIVLETEQNGVNAEREGKIYWQWNETFEPALQKAMEMLFYLQLIPEMSSVKIWERDEFM